MTVDELKTYLHQISPLLVSYALRIIGVLLLFWISVKLARAVQSRVVRSLDGRGFDKTLGVFLGALIRWLILLGSILACLGVFGVETTSFAAVIGAAGLAVGLAFQGTLSSFAAGVMLIVFRPFEVDDVVNISGVVGKVVEIGLFATILDTADNRRIILPNAEVFNKKIENMTAHEYRRVDIAVGVEYGASVALTREVLERAARSVEGWDEERGIQIYLNDIQDSSVSWAIRIWCRTEDYWNLRERAVEAIKRELDSAGIAIPYQQLDVHLDGDLNRAS